MKRWAVALPVLVAVTVAIVGGGAAVGAPREDAKGAPAIPMSASVTTRYASSMLIAMGDLGNPSNTFWELFSKRAASTSWSLETPPGVASNGGLVLAAPSSGSLAVGFLTSGALQFSPVAVSSDMAHTWSPGVLPSPLIAAPDALAVGSKGEVLAVVTAAGQRVLMAPADLSSWRTLTSTTTLKSVSPACDLQEVTAVAFNGAQPLLGLGCAATGEVGILAPVSSAVGHHSGWREVGPRLTAGDGAPTVIRLVSTTNGVMGLAELRTKKGTSLMAFWGEGSLDRWSASPVTAVPSGWTIRATATGGGSGQGAAVLLGSGDQRRVEDVAGPQAHWVALPDPPQGASGVAEIGVGVDTFVVRGSLLRIWTRTFGASAWRQVASVSVPVPYGSSS